MKLAFNSEAHYPDFVPGYELYLKRARKEDVLDYKTYKKVVKAYCRKLSDRLEKEGMIDFPNGMGSIAIANITRKALFRGNKFIGYGKMNWETGQYDGTLKAFGVVFLPRIESKIQNLRCLGFVANRQLFKRLKALFTQEKCKWMPIEYNDEMI